jgi:hypothetical protein
MLEFRVSHILLRFENLEAAVQSFRDLGFAVVSSPHWGGAWIYLPDGVLLEFLPRQGGLERFLAKGGEILQSRLVQYKQRRLLDFCLTPKASFAELEAHLRAQDLSYETLGGWCPHLALPWFPLPLLFNPLMPQPIHLPSQHPNGVVGLHALCLHTPNLLGQTLRFRRLLGQSGFFENTAQGRRAVFTIGPHLLYLQTSIEEGLQTLILRTRHPLEGGLDRAQTQGVAIYLLGDPILEPVLGDEKGER